MVTTLLVALLTALASLVHIPVGDSDFRVTLGMVVMMTGYLILKKKKVLRLAFLRFVRRIVACSRRCHRRDGDHTKVRRLALARIFLLHRVRNPLPIYGRAEQEYL